MRALALLPIVGPLLGLAACGAPPPPPPVIEPPPPPPPVIATLEQLRAAYGQCVQAPLAPDTFTTIEAAGSAWKVQAFDLGVTIDLTAATCNGAPLQLGPVGATKMDDIIANATLCVKGPPWNARGTDSPLILARPRVHATATRLTVEYDETEPQSRPSGAELAVDLATGKCGIVGRD